MDKASLNYDFEELAGLLCGLTEAQINDVINARAGFDALLIANFGVDFERFSKLAIAIFGTLNVGVNSVTDSVCVGSYVDRVQIGPKKDVQSDFLRVAAEKGFFSYKEFEHVK